MGAEEPTQVLRPPGPPRARRILETASSFERRSSCSQMRTTVHPRRRRRPKLRRSRARLASILTCQNGVSLFRQTGKRQPCQKSPSTNTATRLRVGTMSGRPGSESTLVRKRTECFRRALRSDCSRAVPRCRTRRMSEDRFSRLMMSVMTRITPPPRRRGGHGSGSAPDVKRGLSYVASHCAHHRLVFGARSPKSAPRCPPCLV